MKIGTKLRLECQRLDDQQIQKYRSKIIDQNEHYLFIDIPTNMTTDQTTFLPKQTKIQVFYVTEQENLFTFTTVYIKRVDLNVPALMIQRPAREAIQKIQRREFVRIKCALNIVVQCFEKSFSPFKTVTLDISGGGLQMIVPPGNTLQNEQELLVWIALSLQSNEITKIKTEATVVRTEQQENQQNTASIAFTSLTYHEEQQIVQFCFARQQEQRLCM